MRLPRLAPRLAISLPISALFLAARAADHDGAMAAMAAALIAAMVAPANGVVGIATAAVGALAQACLPHGCRRKEATSGRRKTCAVTAERDSPRVK